MPHNAAGFDRARRNNVLFRVSNPGITDRFPALSLASPSLFRKRGRRRRRARAAVAGETWPR